MDTRLLRSFINVADLGSISAAAERLHIAQPALSRHILTLERELRVQLFVRHGRGVNLTEHGEKLLPRALEILRQIEAAREEAHRHETVLSGTITIGFPPTVGHVLASSLADRFLKQYPSVNLHIVEAYSGYVLSWLQQGTLDIAILYEGGTHHTISTSPLLVEQLMAIGRPEHFKDREQLSFKSLRDHALILPGPVHGLRMLLETLASSAGIDLNPIVETDSLRLQIDLVRRGHGITILPLVPVYKEVEAGELIAVSLAEPQAFRQLNLALPADRPLSIAALKMQEMIRSEVRTLVASGRWMSFLVDDDVDS